VVGKGWSSGSLMDGGGGGCFCGKGCWSGGEGVEGTVGGCASVGEDVEVVERGLGVAYGGLRWGCGGFGGVWIKGCYRWGGGGGGTGEKGPCVSLGVAAC